MVLPVQRWVRIALFNLLIVASLGVILRYKILYPLPFVDQKHLLHGHSHFAFAGWISQAIMTLLVTYLSRQGGEVVYKRYQWLLYANLFTAYGMLVAFPIEGYGLYSIIFSTASIVVSYVFAVLIWRDLNRLPQKSPTHLWLKAAVFFNAFSSLGAFALTIMMVQRVVFQNAYLASEYFYLHFQYNGWFFFGCMGLLSEVLRKVEVDPKILTRIFWIFFFAAVPAYFLSALWMDLPVWVYILVVIAAVAQVAGWGMVLIQLKKKWVVLKNTLPLTAKWIMGFSAVALTAKLLLQLGSTVPSLSDLAFGFRPIVIGYLHLVLLGVISLFLLGYFFAGEYIHANKKTSFSVFLFASGVILNEILLMVQGVSAMSYTGVPFINELLLATAAVLFSGAFLLFVTSSKIFRKVI
ncbi:MAG: hypothetical protein KTQ13_01770 [Ferruginibacter sp.]|nr:hypothetical protein [Chitinophagaceae bacterium]MBP6285608.1 hypothetical protein [Ferruginibacter sp.]MBU9935351.1 hypothetical protein [Ferruginibacter sp.]